MMIKQIMRYLFPRKRLYSVPRVVSAEYYRGEISREESLVLCAGLVRDPAGARDYIARLKQLHGEKYIRAIHFELHRKSFSTFKKRLYRAFLWALGEREHNRYERRRKPEAIMFTRFKP